MCERLLGEQIDQHFQVLDPADFSGQILDANNDFNGVGRGRLSRRSGDAFALRPPLGLLGLALDEIDQRRGDFNPLLGQSGNDRLGVRQWVHRQEVADRLRLVDLLAIL
jgi:hypothetical protein